MNTLSSPSISRRRPGMSLQLCRLTSRSFTVTVLHGTHGSKPPTVVSCTIVGHRFHLHTARQPSKHEPRCRPPGSGQCPGWDNARHCSECAGSGRVQHPPDENKLLEILQRLQGSFSGFKSQQHETSADNTEVLASAGFPRFATAFARGSQQDARSRPPA